MMLSRQESGQDAAAATSADALLLEQQWRATLAEVGRHQQPSSQSRVTQDTFRPTDGLAAVTMRQRPLASPAAPAANGSGLQLPSHFYAEPPPSRAESLRKWYQTHAFMRAACLLGVFFVAFIGLIAIRPPFLYSDPEDKLKEREFSTANAAWMALGSTVLAGIIMVILYFVGAKQAATAAHAAAK